MQAAVGRALGHALQVYRTRVALSVDEVTYSYGRLEELADAVAGHLAMRGLRPGQVVGVLLRNQAEYVAIDIALLRYGFIKVPLNEMLSHRQVEYMLEHSGAAVVLVAAELEHLAAAAGCERVIVGATDAREGRGIFGSAQPIAEKFHRPPTSDDVAVIYYTGGTTGDPKGVVHRGGPLLVNLWAQIAEAEIRDGERIIVSTPLPHAAGLFVAAGLLRGAVSTVLPSYDPVEFVSECIRTNATWTFAVPTMLYRLLSDAGPQLDSLTLDTVVYGASPIAPARLTELMDRMSRTGFVQLYGQTECPNWGTRFSKQQHRDALETAPTRLASCGTASLMAEVSIVDAHGAHLPAGDVGEVVLRAPYVMDGYHRNEELTRLRIDPDGWLRTGDVGRIDEAGYLFLVDRMNDMIISGGMNVYTSEVEAVLSEVEGISQVVVLGVPDDDWGESVLAVVMASDEQGVVLERIDRHARRHLAKYQRPKRIEFVAELAVTAYGKPDKKALRARYWTGKDREIH